jgi:CHRD domain-containing protein
MKHIRLMAAFAAGLLAALGVGVALSAESETSQNQLRAGFAALNGENEIGNDGQRNAGDGNGRGAFSGIFKGDTLCYGLQVTNIGKPVAAHIHQASRGDNGDVVVTLKQPRRGNPGASKQCVDVPANVADDIRSNPGGFYVNVHNAKFPGGAIRGQLFSR